MCRFAKLKISRPLRPSLSLSLSLSLSPFLTLTCLTQSTAGVALLCIRIAYGRVTIRSFFFFLIFFSTILEFLPVNSTGGVQSRAWNDLCRRHCEVEIWSRVYELAHAMETQGSFPVCGMQVSWKLWLKRWTISRRFIRNLKRWERKFLLPGISFDGNNRIFYT